MIMLDATPTPKPEVIGRSIDNEAVLVLPQTGKVKVLNEVGSRIWDLIDGSRSVREIADILCADFDVPAATAQQDAVEFITTLVDRNIVTLNS